MNNFYVYAYLRKDGRPYYIGKGTGNRAWSKNHPGIGVPKQQSAISILIDNIDECKAHMIESCLIGFFGRKDLATGILYNRTNGGEGSSGRILNESTKRKLAKITAARNASKTFGFGMGHASTSGAKGGKSKSAAKIQSARINLAKTRGNNKGRIWMFHPEHKTRKRVKPEDVTMLSLKGYQQGNPVFLKEERP